MKRTEMNDKADRKWLLEAYDTHWREEESKSIVYKVAAALALTSFIILFVVWLR